MHGGAAGDPLQLVEKAEKQRWMLIASVAFGWGRGEVTMCSNIIKEVGAERIGSLKTPLENSTIPCNKRIRILCQAY